MGSPHPPAPSPNPMGEGVTQPSLVVPAPPLLNGWERVRGGEGPPAEPTALRASTRALLEQSPTEGLQLIHAGEWITPLFWDAWEETLVAYGWDQARLRQIVVDYSNELRLWVVGERTWE